MFPAPLNRYVQVWLALIHHTPDMRKSPTLKKEEVLSTTSESDYSALIQALATLQWFVSDKSWTWKFCQHIYLFFCHVQIRSTSCTKKGSRTFQVLMNWAVSYQGIRFRRLLFRAPNWAEKNKSLLSLQYVRQNWMQSAERKSLHLLFWCTSSVEFLRRIKAMFWQ